MKWWVRAAVLGVLPIVLLACREPRPSRVVVGIGMTSNTYDAVKLATGEINAAGGIDGVRLEVAGLDGKGADSFDPARVIAAAARFNTIPNLVAVIGHNDSAATLSAAASYNRDGIPQIVTIATNPAITNIGTWTYRLCLSDSAQGPALADYAVKDWQKRRIAIIYVNDDYGRTLARLFEDRARALGAEIVATAMHHNALTDDDRQTIRETLEDMKKANADLVALFQRVDAALWTVRTLRGAGMGTDVLGGDNLAQFSFAGVDPRLSEGVRVSQFLHLDASKPRVAKFVAGIRAATGYEPDYAQAFAYDAMYLVRDAVLHGGFSRTGVKDYLDDLVRNGETLQGVTGSYLLAADHDARRPLYIGEIHGGNFRLLRTVPVR